MNDESKNDEPVEYIEKDVVGVVSLTSLLRDLVLIKKYAMDKNDEKIYLCADHIEEELNKLRYGNFILETDW